MEFQFAINNVMTIKDCASTAGDTWTCTMVVHDDCQPAWRAGPEWHFDLVATTKDGKIRQIKLTGPASEAKIYDQEFPKLTAWIQANRPDDWQKMDVQPVYTKATGELWSQACKAYIATLK